MSTIVIEQVPPSPPPGPADNVPRRKRLRSFRLINGVYTPETLFASAFPRCLIYQGALGGGSISGGWGHIFWSVSFVNRYFGFPGCGCGAAISRNQLSVRRTFVGRSSGTLSLVFCYRRGIQSSGTERYVSHERALALRRLLTHWVKAFDEHRTVSSKEIMHPLLL